MKVYGWLAAFACAFLALAAVVLGGLNQDEGVYVYAANMVRDGFLPYRDFFFTQAPLMPHVYSIFGGAWDSAGILGARLVTCAVGLLAIFLAVLLARRIVPAESRSAAGLVTFFLLGSNLYHLYYTSIPKTYALASFFVVAGFYVLSFARGGGFGRDGVPSPSAAGGKFGRDGVPSPSAAGGGTPALPKTARRVSCLVLSGLLLAFAAGTRISLGALLATTGLALLASFRTRRWDFVWFGLGGALGLALVYGPVVADPASRAGLVAAQQYHTARGGFDIVFVVGSVSRLVRWYLPVFVMLGLGVWRSEKWKMRSEKFSIVGMLVFGFLAVFAAQMLAPFPYEDYQVPVMPLLAVVAAVLVAGEGVRREAGDASEGEGVRREAGDARGLETGDKRRNSTLLLALGLTWAASFGSPLLQEWMTNGQDRFWSLKKEKPELLQLRDVARRIEAEDPGGKTLLTQDLYLAVECRRRVPRGLELGPFSMLDDAEWTNLLESVDCPVAAFSGYGFAIEPPRCNERPVRCQMALWEILRQRYDLAFAEEAFGQNATTLLVLRKK